MKRSGDKQIGLWLLILLLAACASTPTPSMTWPTAVPWSLPTTPTVPVTDSAWRVWQVDAAPDAVLTVVAHANRLWVGTRSGVWQIDPVTRQPVRHDEQLGQVGQLLPVEHEQMWALGARGWFFFDGQSWRRIELPDHIKNYSDSGGVHTMALDKTGDLWLVSGAWRGVSVFRYHGHIPAGTQLSPNLDGTNTPDFTDPDCQQVPVFEAGYNLVYQSSEECRALKAARQAVSVEPYSVTPLAVDAQGNRWWAQQNTLQHNLKDVIMPVSLPSQVNALEADPVRGIWAGTDEGLVYTDGITVQRVALSAQRDTIAAEPEKITVDSQGRMWLLTVADQIAWLQPDRSPQLQYLPENNVRDLTLAPDGNLWLTHGHDLVKFNPDEPAAAPLVHPFTDYQLGPLTVDAAGNVWALTYTRSIVQYHSATKRWIEHQVNLSIDYYAGKIVALPDGAVYIFGGAKFSQLAAPGGMLSGTRQPALETAYEVYTHADTAVPDAYTSPAVQDAVSDRHNRLWFLTATTNLEWKLWRFDQDQITAVQLPFNNCQQIILHVDAQDQLWAADNRQLARYTEAGWHTTGLPAIGYLNSITSAPDGRVWIAGDRGLAVYDPALDK